MTPAERKRRSRAFGATLRTQSATVRARSMGGSPQWYRDLDYVQKNGVPEWKQTFDDKGRMLIGVSTQRQMVKHLSHNDQRTIISLAKRDKKEALAAWRLAKEELGIK